MYHIISSVRSHRERFTMEVIDKDGYVIDDEIAFTCGKAAAFKVEVVEAVDVNLDARSILNSLTSHMSQVSRILQIYKDELEVLEEEKRQNPTKDISTYRAYVLHDRAKRELDDLVHYYTNWNSLKRIIVHTSSVVVSAQSMPEPSAATPALAPWTLDDLSPQQRRYSNRT